jgi:hypothetical protein
MNPPRGEVGAPRQVRVCDACYGMGQTFDFQASPLPASRHVRSLKSLRRQLSDECLSGSADKCQQSKGHSRSLSSLRGLRHIASAPCLNSMVDSSGHGRPWPQPDTQLERTSGPQRPPTPPPAPPPCPPARLSPPARPPARLSLYTHTHTHNTHTHHNRPAIRIRR